MPPETTILNYINGQWRTSEASEWLDVINPATAELLGRTPLSPAADVEQPPRQLPRPSLAGGARRRRTASSTCFKLRDLMKTQIDDISRTITMECGKTFDEAKAEMRRAIENVEVACGIPILSQGVISEDIAPGIDEIMIRQPVGVCAPSAPFNFPGMIPFWFLPYALACGNTYIVKPSEKVPLTMQKIFQLVEAGRLPQGGGQPGQRRQRSGGCHPRPPRYPRRSASSARRRWRSTSMPPARPTASASRRRAAPRTRSSSCRTQTWKWQCASPPTAPSAAPGSAAWRPRWRSRWAKRASEFTEAHLRCRRQPRGRLRAGSGRADGTGHQPGRASSASRS